MDSTPSSNKAWFGADPGGVNSFGVALLTGENQVHHDVVSSVDEAIEWLLAKLENTGADLCGAGIDAPMWFSSGKGGGRLADQRIRSHYKIPSGTVQSANSLAGAALTQGHMLALRLREEEPDLPITEAHPKALILVSLFNDGSASTPRLPLFPDLWKELHEEAEKISEETTGSEHRRDAILCAIAARESFDDSPRWTHDLTKERYFLSEQDPQGYSLAPMHYYWPEVIQSIFVDPAAAPAPVPGKRLTRRAWKALVAPFIGSIAAKHSLSWRWTRNDDLTLEVTNSFGRKAEITAGGIWFHPPLKPLSQYVRGLSGVLGKVVPKAVQQSGILPIGCALPVTPEALDLVLQEIAILL